MSLPVITTMKDMKEKKRIKTKIVVGSVAKVKVGEMDEKTTEGRSRSKRKEVMGCVQAVVGKKNPLVQSKDRQRREMRDSSLSNLCEKEEVGQEVDETISDLPKRGQDRLLTIDGDPRGQRSAG